VSIDSYQKYGTIIGRVVGYNDYGCYVRDEATDRVVFYYGHGTKGDRVQLSILRVDQRRESVTCVLESVLEYGRYAA
jgi:hypothetical protein